MRNKDSFEVYKTNSTDFSALSESELETLRTILQRLCGKNAKQLSDLSHGERAYRETENGELIPYSYALDLIGA